MPRPRIFTHVVSFVELSIALVALSAAVPALSAPSAQQRHLTEAQIAEIEQRFEEIRERLNLTDEQRTAMEPILRRSIAERIGILEKYGVSRNGGNQPGFRQLRAMRKELEAAREQTEREPRRHHARDLRARGLYCATRRTGAKTPRAPDRYHGVFAPASRDRARIVPGTRSAASAARGEVSVSDRQRAMSWAQRLKRVFAIDI